VNCIIGSEIRNSQHIEIDARARIVSAIPERQQPDIRNWS